MASKPKPRRKGYDQGGGVGAGINQAMRGGMMMAQLAKMYGAGGGMGGSGGAGGAMGAMGGNDPMARGGKIKRVAGKPIGKDDGLIPAQRGEYVVRKSAVNKLGTKALNTINKGKLPGKGAR